mgnify:FL=1
MGPETTTSTLRVRRATHCATSPLLNPYRQVKSFFVHLQLLFLISNKGKVSCSRKQTGAFDGARNHDLNITSQTCNPLRHVTAFKSISSGELLFS